MKYGKKLLSAAVTFLLLCSMILAVNGESPFHDVPADSWYAEAVNWCFENGIVNGTAATTFSPDGTMDRAMLAAMLYRASGSPYVTGSAEFSDVEESSYYENAILWAAENGILFGYGNGRVGPNDPVTREQIVTILWRYTGSPDAEGGVDFSDAADISDYAVPAVRWAQSNSIIKGMEENRFAPKESATRAQVAVILYRFLNQEENPPQSPDDDKDGDTPQWPSDHTGQDTESMDIFIGEYRFTVTLEKNATAAALAEKLPLELAMSELNGNEKYNYLPFRLPTDSYAPRQILAGDVMLYGDDCLVVFYKSFSSPYSYTKIGHIEDVAGLQDAVGDSNVQMIFTK